MAEKTRRLKEFALDAPSLDREARSRFLLQTRFLTSNVERHFKPYTNNEGAWKILVEVVPIPTYSDARNLLGVLSTQVSGDPASYAASPKGLREQLALNWLLRGVHNVFSEYGWPVEQFEAAVASVLEAGFKNVFVWKRGLFNKSRSASVDLVVETDENESRIVAIFRTPGSEVASTSTLCVRSPSEFSYLPCLGKLEWLDDHKVQLSSRSGLETWTASNILLN